MLNAPDKLRELDSPISVGVIGTGFFGTKLVDQIERTPGMKTAVIADLDPSAAADAYREANVQESNFETASGPEPANRVVENGNRAVLKSGKDLAKTTVDVIVESTGVPNAGAEHAYVALENGKHVVMVTVEADTVVGPTLAKLADENNVTYSLAYGDQPALIVELYDWAESVGLDVVAAGKGVGMTKEYRFGTPEDVFERMGYGEDFVEEQNLNARMYNSFVDGTKVSVEMCAVANATGLEPDVPGMHLPTAEIPEIPEKLSPSEDGGLLEHGEGAIDTVLSLYPDGTSVEDDISFGVFVVTTTPNERVQTYLDEYSGAGMYVSNEGKYQLFHRPYHLPGTETTISVARAALYNEATGTPKDRVAEVVGAAKKKLEPGDEIDGGGGYTVYGSLEKYDYALERNHVPFELLSGAKVINDVERDQVVTYEDVEIKADTFLHELRLGED